MRERERDGLGQLLLLAISIHLFQRGRERRKRDKGRERERFATTAPAWIWNSLTCAYFSSNWEPLNMFFYSTCLCLSIIFQGFLYFLHSHTGGRQGKEWGKERVSSVALKSDRVAVLRAWNQQKPRQVDVQVDVLRFIYRAWRSNGESAVSYKIYK